MLSLELTRQLTPGQEQALLENHKETFIIFEGEELPLGSFLLKIRREKIPLTDSQIVVLRNLLVSISFVPGGSKVAP